MNKAKKMDAPFDVNSKYNMPFSKIITPINSTIVEAYGIFGIGYSYFVFITDKNETIEIDELVPGGIRDICYKNYTEKPENLQIISKFINQNIKLNENGTELLIDNKQWSWYEGDFV